MELSEDLLLVPRDEFVLCELPVVLPWDVLWLSFSSALSEAVSEGVCAVACELPVLLVLVPDESFAELSVSSFIVICMVASFEFT